ncbi:MAG: rhodanese-like domain-containing protein, partial [Candidatus Thiodiazotropha taylori]
MEMEKVSTISPSKLYVIQSQDEKVDLLDVRTGMEYNSGHIPGAKLMTLDDISDKSLIEQLGDPNEREQSSIYVTCQSGFRAQQAVERIRATGYQNLVLVEGGTEGWERAGLPMKRVSRVISLERQVQI